MCVLSVFALVAARAMDEKRWPRHPLGPLRNGLFERLREWHPIIMVVVAVAVVVVVLVLVLVVVVVVVLVLVVVVVVVVVVAVVVSVEVVAGAVSLESFSCGS